MLGLKAVPFRKASFQAAFFFMFAGFKTDFLRLWMQSTGQRG
jgi:hypothetical protein